MDFTVPYTRTVNHVQEVISSAEVHCLLHCFNLTPCWGPAECTASPTCLTKLTLICTKFNIFHACSSLLYSNSVSWKSLALLLIPSLLPVDSILFLAGLKIKNRTFTGDTFVSITMLYFTFQKEKASKLGDVTLTCNLLFAHCENVTWLYANLSYIHLNADLWVDLMNDRNVFLRGLEMIRSSFFPDEFVLSPVQLLPFVVSQAD